MKKLHHHPLLTALALLCSIALSACDDSSGAGPTGNGGTAGSAGEGGESGMSGQAGNSSDMGSQLCIDDDGCTDESSYCNITEGGRLGECVPGCREDSCEDGQVCNLETRECEDEPCESDGDCPDDEYCDESGECTPGCRSTEESCSELDDMGRSQVCDLDSRTCLPLMPCCTGVDMCTVELEQACIELNGESLQGAADCSTNPCGVVCVEDADCGADASRFCNMDDGRCQDGCRTDDPLACGEGQLCSDETHQCVDLLCGNDSDCPDDRYCEIRDGRGLCFIGCRGDEDCADGESCIDNECVTVCDPADENACADGQFCNPDTLRCQDLCTVHADCEEGRFCDAESGICLPGCRDDEGDGGEPNNDFDTATPILLGDANDDGERFGSIDGRILCDNDPDVLRVDVPPGARVQIDVTFDQGTPSFALDGRSGNCGDDSNCNEELQWSCIDRVCSGPNVEVDGRDQHAFVRYPDVGELIQDVASYYVTIAPTNQRIEYRVDVVVVDAQTGCFSDISERDGGDDTAETSTPLPSGYVGTRRGTICGGVSDWFRIGMDPNDGLSLTLRSEDGEPIDAYLFAAGSERGQPILRAAEDSDRIDRAQGTTAFVPGGDWYLLVTGRGPDTNATYELEVLHSPAVFDCGDDDQGGTIETSAMVNVDVGEPVNIGATLGSNLSICNADGADVDVFCFDVGDNEVLTGALVMNGPQDEVGLLRLQFMNEDGEFRGNDAVNGVGEPGGEARVLGTNAGQYCARVSGINRAQGEYDLLVSRSDMMGAMCGLDITENMGVRNDRSNMPTVLEPLDEEGTRFQFEDGYICDTFRSDEDWYQFSINEENSSLCLTVTGFDADVADVDVAVYPSQGNPEGLNCTAGGQQVCDEGGGGACIASAGGNQSYCTPAFEREATNSNFELIQVRRTFLRDRTGDFLVRVTHDDENEGPYQLGVDVTPPTNQCPPDRFEPNDEWGDDAALGSGEVAICSGWICNQGQIRENDRYKITVPAGEDRTIILNFSSASEADLQMDAFDPGDDPMVQFRRVRGFIRETNYQCINVRGGSENADVRFNVYPVSTSFENNLLRSDYNVRVVPTDLDANPAGACSILGAQELDACTPRDTWPENEFCDGCRIQPENCWPVLDLP